MYKNRWKNIDISIFLDVNLRKIFKFRKKLFQYALNWYIMKMENYFDK